MWWSTPIGHSHQALMVAARIAEAIWLGELAVGDRIPSERDLAVRLDLSRPTVRAALRDLRRQGLLEVRHGRAGGSFVRTDLVPEHLLPPLPQAAPGVPDLLEARRAVELQVARLAAVHATDADLEMLSRTVQRQRSASHDWDVNIQFDVKFHLQLARATHNQMIWLIGQTLQRHIWRSRLRALRMPHDPELVADIHERTLQAIRGKDLSEIELAMDQHLGWLERDRELDRRDEAPGSRHHRAAN